MAGGGGSAAGAVDHPVYLKLFHGQAIGGTTDLSEAGWAASADMLSVSLVEAMNTALSGASPYSGFVTVDVDDALLGATGVITAYSPPFSYLTTFCGLDFDGLLEGYKDTGILATYVAAKETRLAAVIAAESALLDDDITNNTLPAFKGGMRDINAVMSSAFVIGESNIWAQKARALAKSDAILRWEAEKLQAELALRVDEIGLRQTLAFMEVKRTIAITSLEFAKTYITARAQGDDFILETNAKDLLWDLKVFQYGGNFMGAINGSAVSVDSGSSTGQKLAGVASSAMAGAAIGSMVPGIGTAIGAGAGALVGALGAYA